MITYTIYNRESTPRRIESSTQGIEEAGFYTWIDLRSYLQRRLDGYAHVEQIEYGDIETWDASEGAE